MKAKIFSGTSAFSAVIGSPNAFLEEKMMMLRSLVVLVALLALPAIAFGQAIEMAAQCDQAKKRLEELVKNPDLKEVAMVKAALGLDILASCATTEGQVTCFQCLDKDQKLTALQIVKDTKTGKFRLLGFGCPCGAQK